LTRTSGVAAISEMLATGADWAEAAPVPTKPAAAIAAPAIPHLTFIEFLLRKSMPEAISRLFLYVGLPSLALRPAHIGRAWDCEKAILSIASASFASRSVTPPASWALGRRSRPAPGRERCSA
jgi:hypothetical protein